MPEWYEAHGSISIGCQSYGPGSPIGELKVPLNKFLDDRVPSVKVGPIRHLAIALRVGGQFHDFEETKISRVRVQKKSGYVGCDIELPRSAWQVEELSLIQTLLAEWIIKAIDQMLDVLEKRKFQGNYEAIRKASREATEAWLTTGLH